MNIAIVSCDSNEASSVLAGRLTELRSANGCPTLVREYRDSISASGACCTEIVTDVSSLPLAETKTAIAEASVVLVLVSPEDIEAGRHESLLARLHCMRKISGGARILVVPVHESGTLSTREVGAHLIFVSRIAKAGLADCLVCGVDGLFRPRHAEAIPITDRVRRGCNVPQVRHLYDQILHGAPAMA